MEAVNLALGIAGTVVSSLGLVYAYLAARRSDSLLHRLVIYPFRELDGAFARLNQGEQQALRELFVSTNDGKNAITGGVLRDIKPRVRDFGPEMLSYLENERWLYRSGADVLRINSDRAPYLTFLLESEPGRARRGT